MKADGIEVREQAPPANGTPPMPQAGASPIADLSYRNYDGPLHTRAVRWWIVALANMRLVKKKKGFWGVSLLALVPYIFVGAVLYFQSRAPAGAPNPFMSDEKGQRFSSMFFQALQNQGLWLFVVTLLAGAGSIAADNQTNALLVYLSKPLTKGDYLLGKWMGIFLVVFGVAAAPALVLYLYCLLSYTGDGFLRDEPWLIVRMLAACAVPGAIHASVMVGVSAWSKTPRMAGAVYAGIYFVTQIVSGAFWGIRYRGDLEQGVLARHMSLDGIIMGVAQNAYGVTLRTMMGSRRMHTIKVNVISAPPVWAMLSIAVVLIVVGVVAARARIRAVEVVRG